MPETHRNSIQDAEHLGCSAFPLTSWDWWDASVALWFRWINKGNDLIILDDHMYVDFRFRLRPTCRIKIKVFAGGTYTGLVVYLIMIHENRSSNCWSHEMELSCWEMTVAVCFWIPIFLKCINNNCRFLKDFWQIPKSLGTQQTIHEVSQPATIGLGQGCESLYGQLNFDDDQQRARRFDRTD